MYSSVMLLFYRDLSKLVGRSPILAWLLALAGRPFSCNNQLGHNQKGPERRRGPIQVRGITHSLHVLPCWLCM